MLTLPKTIIQVLRQFEEFFSERVWEWAKVLVIGAILAPGERTVAAILRVGLDPFLGDQRREMWYKKNRRILQVNLMVRENRSYR